MKNTLKITTPYQSCKTISSNFNLDVEAGHKYIFGLDMDYQNETKLVKVSIRCSLHVKIMTLILWIFSDRHIRKVSS